MIEMLPVAIVLATLWGSGPELPAPQEPETAAANLRWSAPPSCPDREAVLTELASRVDLDALAIAVEIHAADEAMLHAEVAITGPHGATSRTLESPACQSIVDAVVLLAEVTAESMPSRTALTGTPVPVPAPPPAGEPAALREATTAPAVIDGPVIDGPVPVAPAPRTRVRGGRTQARFAAAAVVGGNLVPGVDAGARLSIGIARPRVIADLGGAYVGRGQLRPNDDVRVRFDAWAVVARACPVVPLPTPRLALAICGIAAAGGMVAQSSGPGLLASRTRAQPWLRLAAGPELGVVLGPRIRLVAGLELGGHVMRPGFTLGGLGRIWSPSGLSAHGLLGIEVRVP